jgi:hypothetical protein
MRINKMSQQDKENRIIEKIRKLFALANDKGATGAESENALRMANAMLSKHSLEMHQLTGHDESVFCTFAEYNLKTPGNVTAIGAICRLYNCRIVFDYNWDVPKSLIIGTGANRMTATIVIDQILDQIQKECKGENAAYKQGAADGLAEICRRLIRQRQKDTTEILPGTGLMVIDQMKQQALAVDAFIDENFANLKNTRKKKGSEEGRAYGRGLNPGARVGGEGQRKLN